MTEYNTNFTRLTFPTKKDADDYISRRSINPYDDYGRLKPGVDLTKQDGLFLKVGYSCAKQPDGTWLLVF